MLLMHQHDCRFCGGKFYCDKGVDCFEKHITCRDCSGEHLVFMLGVGLVALTVTLVFISLLTGII